MRLIASSRFNTAQRFSGLPQGLEAVAGPTEKVATVGANLRIGEGVVLKADYQKFMAEWYAERK